MKSVLVNLFLLRKFICIYLFCYFYISIVAAERSGLLYLKFLCYKNEENKLSNGEICDVDNSNMCPPTFTICISNQKITDEITKEKCNVHYHITRTYYNYYLICNNPLGSRKNLEIEIKRDPYFRLQKTYFVKIEVRDLPRRHNRLIASFGAEFNQVPSANGSQVVYKDMRMNRTDLSHGNPRVSLDISMGLQCDRYHYGENCMDLCIPNSQNAFPCTQYDPRVCKKGWKGEQCATKDLCAFVSCIKSGQCLEINGKAECWCNNKIGPHCYSSYNPCSNNPCQNEGFCTPQKFSEIGYNCQCKYPFSGPQCTNKFDICESKPCRNNASCHYIKPDAFYCKCVQGFNGRYCDLMMVREKSSNFNFGNYVVLICSLFFGILFIILVMVFTWYFIRKRRARKNKKLQQIDEKPKIKKELERKIHSSPVISNKYLEVPLTETAYEEIDERYTYGSLLDKNDDYLVPDCVTTLSSDPLQIYSENYLEMSENSDIHETESKEIPVKIENFYLPLLPTREPKTHLI